MITMIEKPIERSIFRRWLGREFYIAKRWIKWHDSFEKHPKANKKVSLPYLWKSHKSVCL